MRVKFIYPESVLGVVVSQPGDLVVESGECEEAPAGDVLELFQETAVKLQPEECHEGEVGETGEDVDQEEEDEQTFHHNIDCVVRGDDR